MNADADIFARQGFGGLLGLRAPFALLLVDFVNGFADPDQFGGGNIAAAIERSRRLLTYARSQHWPIAHTRIVFADDGSDSNVFTAKMPKLLTLTEYSAASAVVDSLTPLPMELIVRKKLPSAFFGTDLAPWLTAEGTRTLVIGGCVTSGCVRASVVDAMCHGFRPVVIEDCVGDRALGPHDAALFDMRQKYADLLTLDQLMNATEARLP
jgi:maleamate amidohydrolase